MWTSHFFENHLEITEARVGSDRDDNDGKTSSIVMGWVGSGRDGNGICFDVSFASTVSMVRAM